MDLTEAEDIKKRWQEYTKELYKKDLDHLLLAENSNSGSVLVWFLVGPSFNPPFSGGSG